MHDIICSIGQSGAPLIRKKEPNDADDNEYEVIGVHMGQHEADSEVSYTSALIMASVKLFISKTIEKYNY